MGLLYDGVCTVCLQGKCHVVVPSCVCAPMCAWTTHMAMYTQASVRVGHMMPHAQLAGSVAALACLSGDLHACLRKAQRGLGCIVCNWQTPVRPCNGAIPSPPARTDCWGCALRHGAKTVRPQGGAAIFPCYSGAAARSLVTIVAHHTDAGSAEATMLPDARGAERLLYMLCTE